MPEYGFNLSSEEHEPSELVRYARMAEDAGFSFAFVSDHFHPWVDQQGHSAFVSSSRYGNTSAQASTISTSTRSGPTRRDSSASSSAS